MGKALLDGYRDRVKGYGVMDFIEKAKADGKTGYASQCLECGTCMEKCPQQLRIPEFLVKAAAEMEGPDLEKRVAMARRFSGRKRIMPDRLICLKK